MLRRLLNQKELQTRKSVDLDMWRDILFALRSFARNPGFTIIAALTIALGVGPNTAIFSMVDAVLLRPLPYRDAGSLAMLWETSRQRGLAQVPLSGPNFVDWRRESRSFEEMAPAFTIPEYGFNVTVGSEPERARAGQAAANLFQVLGVKPVLGRMFLPAEDRPGGPPVVLISHGFWTRRFGAAPSVIGRSIRLDGQARIVVGVLPRELESLAKVDLWIPIAENLETLPRDHHSYGVMARLKPGVTAAQAQTELDVIAAHLEKQYPDSNSGMGALVVPIQSLLTGTVRPALMTLLAAVGFLLLVACVNVANLLLSRSAGRNKEIAIRIALGANRLRIVRQLLTESALLALLGGALGILLAAWSVHLLRSSLPDVIPRLKDMTVDLRVLAFSLLVSVATGVLFGLVPALRGVRGELNDTLKAGGGKGLSGDTGQRARTFLLTGQVALALVLLVSAGLMIRSFLRVLAVDPGFHPEQVLTMQLTLPGAKYADARAVLAFEQAVLRRIEALPGVESAAATNILPARSSLLALRTSVMAFEAEGAARPLPGQEPIADYRSITPHFFKAMGIPLRQGRLFTEQDRAGSRRVALINETMARTHFAGTDPVGRLLRMGPPENPAALIVGVVADIRMQGLEARVEPCIYVPFEQETPHRFSLAIRGASEAGPLAGAVRREILAVDPDQPAADVRTMDEVVSDALLIRRLSVWLLGTFAGLALGLAAVGVYGLTAFSVSRRTHEIGLRRALGAGDSEVIRLLLARGIASALAGVVLGLPAAFALTRVLRGMLFGVAPTDGVTWALVPAILVGTALLASYIPARRALRIDPVEALRYE